MNKDDYHKIKNIINKHLGSFAVGNKLNKLIGKQLMIIERIILNEIVELNDKK